MISTQLFHAITIFAAVATGGITFSETSNPKERTALSGADVMSARLGNNPLERPSAAISTNGHRREFARAQMRERFDARTLSEGRLNEAYRKRLLFQQAPNSGGAQPQTSEIAGCLPIGVGTVALAAQAIDRAKQWPGTWIAADSTSLFGQTLVRSLFQPSSIPTDSTGIETNDATHDGNQTYGWYFNERLVGVQHTSKPLSHLVLVPGVPTVLLTSSESEDAGDEYGATRLWISVLAEKEIRFYAVEHGRNLSVADSILVNASTAVTDGRVIRTECADGMTLSLAGLSIAFRSSTGFVPEVMIPMESAAVPVGNAATPQMVDSTANSGLEADAAVGRGPFSLESPKVIGLALGAFLLVTGFAILLIKNTKRASAVASGTQSSRGSLVLSQSSAVKSQQFSDAIFPTIPSASAAIHEMVPVNAEAVHETVSANAEVSHSAASANASAIVVATNDFQVAPTTACYFCAETIPTSASVCPFCRSNLAPSFNEAGVSTQSNQFAEPHTNQAADDATSKSHNQQPLCVAWHYSTNGKRFGPFTHEALLEEFKSKRINASSQLWNTSWADWKPVLDTTFADMLRDPNAPPPLTGAAVSNGVVWVLAFVPFIGPFLEGFFSEISGIPVASLWVITLSLSVILSAVDEKKIRAAGHDTSRMGAVWFVPVYLYKRAVALKQNNAYFVVWCVTFALSFVL